MTWRAAARPTRNWTSPLEDRVAELEDENQVLTDKLDSISDIVTEEDEDEDDDED